MERFFVFTPVEIALIAVAGVFFIIQLWYCLNVYAKPYDKRRENENKPAPRVYPPVSVIIYSKNESENLRRFLPSVLEQDYPEFQVVVVNDGSTDESDEVLSFYETRYPHLYHTYIPEDVKYLSRKKLALTVGIKAAKHEILLFTEANCRPLGNRWIASMARNFTEHTDIVLGFCAYGHKKGLLDKLAAYDNLVTGVRYLSSALCGKPFTACGKNLAYRKRLFFEHKGFSQFLNLHAGDDDLFVNRLATPLNTRVEYAPESITEVAPYERFKVWKEMKVSRASTMRYYRGHRLLFYRLANLTRYLFIASVGALAVAGMYGNPVSAALGAVLLSVWFGVQAVVLKRGALLLQQKPLTLWLPFLDFFHTVYSVYVRVYRVFRGRNDYTFRLGNK